MEFFFKKAASSSICNFSQNGLHVNFSYVGPPDQGGGAGGQEDCLLLQNFLFVYPLFRRTLFERSKQDNEYLIINTLHEWDIKKHNRLLLIGFYQVKNIKSETLFNIIKVSWVELTINEFQKLR